VGDYICDFQLPETANSLKLSNPLPSYLHDSNKDSTHDSYKQK
jgi:hypothetical protein